MKCRCLDPHADAANLWVSGIHCKDADPFTALSDTVEPLPWRTIPDFPFGREVKRPADPAYDVYLREYQTRPAGGR
jgi:hypothetical protein